MFDIEIARKSKEEIQKLLESQKVEEVSVKLKEYEDKYPFDMDIHVIKSSLYCYKQEYEKAEKELLSIYNKCEYNYELLYNLATVFFYEGKYSKAFEYCVLGMMIDKEKSINMEDFLGEIMINLDKDEIDRIKNNAAAYVSYSQFLFPRCIAFDMDYRVKELNYNKKTYYCGIYDHYLPERDGAFLDGDLNAIPLTKYEIVPGRRSKRAKLQNDEKTIIPLMVKKKQQEVNINVNGIDNLFKYLLPERFYYYKFDKGDKVIINSEEEFILGDKIEVKKDKNIPALVLNIFVDGLSQAFIDKNGLQAVAPNIYNFFKEGTICNNTYSSGEWTYVSLASFFTGEYTTNHRVYEPWMDTKNLFDKEIYTEVLQKQGYLCAKIDGNNRANPATGYMKGLNRYLYQGLRTEEDYVITELIDHLEAFKENNNYVWLGISDLHDVPDDLELRTSVQVNSSIESRSFEKNVATSVKQEKDDKKIERYRQQLKRTDTYLGLLFNYITQNYNEDEFIINLVSDHGQGFLLESDDFMDIERTKVAMMFRGKNIPKGQCDEYISILDLFPIILKKAGVDNFDIKDGNIPEYFGGESAREHVYTESMHPKDEYYAAINDSTHKFYFTTKEKITIDGRIRIDSDDDYIVKLVNRKNGKDETKENHLKVSKYTDEVLDHIKEYIII